MSYIHIHKHGNYFFFLTFFRDESQIQIPKKVFYRNKVPEKFCKNCHFFKTGEYIWLFPPKSVLVVPMQIFGHLDPLLKFRIKKISKHVGLANWK